DTSVTAKSVDALRLVGRVDADAGQTEPNPVSAQRIVGTRLDLGLRLLAFVEHLFLDVFRDVPHRMTPKLAYREFARSRRPVRLANGDRVSREKLAVVEREQHALRQVDDDAGSHRLGHSMAIVDRD